MRLNVAVVYGGRSAEHEISIRSAESIFSGLDANRYSLEKYFIDKEGRWSPRSIAPEPGGNPGIDVVFPIVHGTFGEDGTLQGLLEMADLPYVGPGVLASSICMDKEVAKRLLLEAGIPVVEYYVAAPGVPNPFDYPVFVKPANLGSSLGITKVRSPDDLPAAIAEARRFDRRVIVERAIVGQELECAVLGNAEAKAATPCEILPSREFYDYDDKYLLDKAQTKLPAGVSDADLAAIQRLAVQAFQATHCEGMARVDFLRESATGKLYVNEINTIPGFTSISMYPKMWEHAGLPFPALLDKLLAVALERHAEKKSLRYSR